MEGQQRLAQLIMIVNDVFALQPFAAHDIFIRAHERIGQRAIMRFHIVDFAQRWMRSL